MKLLRKDKITTHYQSRWNAVVSKDTRADGIFYYAVVTTGVYCRPSCPARLPKPENVRFFAARKEAEDAGFRPCKRCKPGQRSQAEGHGVKIAQACTLIENSETTPDLQQLAGAAGLSKYHFHRLFKAAVGLTPKEYAAAHRAKAIRKKLAEGGSITQAIYDVGYGSSSPFYARSNAVLGMTPSRFRSGGAETTIHFAVGECSFGSILVAQSERGICAVLIGDDPQELAYDLQRRFSKAHIIGGDMAFERLVAKVVGFVENPSLGLHLPLDIRGTAFQMRVWKAVRKIPLGSTASYAEIAQSIGMPKAARAVGGACAANKLAIIIPCHRVVRNDGTLSGYRWSVQRKRQILRREADETPT